MSQHKKKRSIATGRDLGSRAARAGLGLGVVAMALGGTYSAFTDVTTTDGNAFESGRLAITDDNSDNDALFTVTAADDGDTDAKCITVENDGNVEYDGLTVKRSAGHEVQAPTPPTDAATNPGLGEDVTFTVTAMNNEVETPGGSCTEFDAAPAADKRTVAGLGGLAKDAGAQASSEYAPLKTAGAKVSYKVEYVVDITNEDMEQGVDEIAFSWEPTQGN